MFQKLVSSFLIACQLFLFPLQGLARIVPAWQEESFGAGIGVMFSHDPETGAVTGFLSGVSSEGAAELGHHLGLPKEWAASLGEFSGPLTVFLTLDNKGDLAIATSVAHNAIENNFLYSFDGIPDEEEAEKQIEAMRDLTEPALRWGQEGIPALQQFKQGLLRHLDQAEAFLKNYPTLARLTTSPLHLALNPVSAISQPSHTLPLARGAVDLLFPETRLDVALNVAGPAAKAGSLALSLGKSTLFIGKEALPVLMAAAKPATKALGKLDARVNAKAFEMVTPNPKSDFLLLEAPEMIRQHIFNKFRGQSVKSQKYREFFANHNIDIDSFTVEIPSAMHRSQIHVANNNWTTKWKEWIDANPTASTKEVYQFAGQLMDEYNINHIPLIPYNAKR